jgi:hypothetical protein
MIPLEKNNIYNIVKNYCLLNNLSEHFYHMTAYPLIYFDNLTYYLETKFSSDDDRAASNPHPDLLHELIEQGIASSEQDIVDAFTWDNSDDGVPT